jgi:uncharacterized protein
VPRTRKWGKLFDFRPIFIVDPSPQVVVGNIPPVRITFPDGKHIFSDQDDIDYNLSKVFGREVRLMKASLDKPSYEEYWPDIEGLAQRDKVTDETMPSKTFFDIAVIHILTIHNFLLVDQDQIQHVPLPTVTLTTTKLGS